MTNPFEVFISYSHDSRQHAQRVAELAARLRADGIHSVMDQDEECPPEGWPRWMVGRIQESRFILIICTETYHKRFCGQEERGKGLGATWEGALITQVIYENSSQNRNFIPVVFSPPDRDWIPLPLRASTFYDLSQPDSYEKLLRRLRTTQSSRGITPRNGTVSPSQELKAKIHNIPYAANPYFTGRKEVLEEIEQALTTSTPGRVGVALSGIGGVGKTDTAVMFAFTHQHRYLVALWARADNHETLLRDFDAIARLLGLPIHPEATKTAAEVRAWLGSTINWLLVLDNVDDLRVLEGLIPTNHQGHLILTTRLAILGPSFTKVDLLEMSADEGALLLLRRAGVIKPNDNLSAAAENELRRAQQLAQEMGGLPLALDQAGAYIEETPSSLEEYFHLYSSHQNSLLAIRGEHPRDHKDPVATTWNLSYEKVRATNPLAGQLVQFCCYLSPEGIPEELFVKAARVLGRLGKTAENPVEFHTTIREACRYSLIRRSANTRTLFIHRLTQVVQRGSTEGQERRRLTTQIIHALCLAVPDVGYGQEKECDRYIPSVLALLGGSEVPDSMATARLFEWLGSFFMHIARPDAARIAFEAVLKIRRRILGENHEGVAISLTNLATTFTRWGLESNESAINAEALLRRALSSVEGNPDTDPKLIASITNNLALLLAELRRDGEAEVLYQRSFALKKRTKGNRIDAANTAVNLALFYITRERYEDGEKMLLWARPVLEKYSAGHPALAKCLTNLGILYRRKGELTEAEKVTLRALDIFDTYLDPTHPDRVPSLVSLGNVYLAQDRFGSAERVFSTALILTAQFFGALNSNLAEVLWNLASAKGLKGQTQEAVAAKTLALAIWYRTNQSRFDQWSPYVSLQAAAFASVVEDDVLKAGLSEVIADAIRLTTTTPDPGDSDHIGDPSTQNSEAGS